MANKIKGEIALPAVDVEGFEKGGTIVLNFNALCALEDELGTTIDSLGSVALKSPKTIRTIFRIGLAHHHGDIADAVAGDVIQELGLMKAAEIVISAMTASFPEAAKDGTGNPPKKGKDGTGKTASAAG